MIEKLEQLQTAIDSGTNDEVKSLVSSMCAFQLNHYWDSYAAACGTIRIGFLHLAIDKGDEAVVNTLLKYGTPRGLVLGLKDDPTTPPIIEYLFTRKHSSFSKERFLSMLYLLLAYNTSLKVNIDIFICNKILEPEIISLCYSEALLRLDFTTMTSTSIRMSKINSRMTVESLKSYCQITTELFGRRQMIENDINSCIAKWHNATNDVEAHRNSLIQTRELLLNPRYFDVTHSASSKYHIRELDEIVAELIYHRGGLSSPLIGEAYCKYHGLEEEPASRKTIYSYKNLSDYLQSPLEVLIADIRCNPGIAAAIKELTENPYTGIDNRQVCFLTIRQNEQLSLKSKLSMEMQRRIIEANHQTKTELSTVKHQVHLQKKKIKRLTAAQKAKDSEIQKLKDELAQMKLKSALPPTSPEKSEMQKSIFSQTHNRRNSLS